MAANLFLMILWVWLWTRFVVSKVFPFMERVNQFLLGLLLGVLTQVLLDLLDERSVFVNDENLLVSHLGTLLAGTPTGGGRVAFGIYTVIGMQIAPLKGRNAPAPGLDRHRLVLCPTHRPTSRGAGATTA